MHVWAESLSSFSPTVYKYGYFVKEYFLEHLNLKSVTMLCYCLEILVLVCE